MNRNVLVIGGVVLGVIVVGVGGLMAAATTQPDNIHVERSLVMAASPADVHAQVNDFNKFVEWSPWDAKDPNATRTVSDPAGGVGASYSWSGNEDVGAGSMTMTRVEPNFIGQKLEFTAPMESSADIGLAMVPEGDGTKVTWTMDMPSNFMLKVMNTVGMADIDAAVGPDFEQGLKNLKVKAEADAAARMAAEKAAAEAAEAERLAMEAMEAEGMDAGGPEGGTPPM
jgi:hypothetical protein